MHANHGGDMMVVVCMHLVGDDLRSGAQRQDPGSFNGRAFVIYRSTAMKTAVLFSLYSVIVLTKPHACNCASCILTGVTAGSGRSCFFEFSWRTPEEATWLDFFFSVYPGLSFRSSDAACTEIEEDVPRRP